VVSQSKRFILALDGPAGVGKSSVAERVARTLGFRYINSGNLYRAVTWAVLHNSSIDPLDEEELVSFVKKLSFTYENDALAIDGKAVNPFLHSDEVDEWVAQVSSYVPIRELVNDKLRYLSSGIEAVVEGRDISTVVFPEADVKIFLDASVETRARRRFSQGTSTLSLDEIRERIRKRDEIDATKKVGRMALSDDAIYLDTSYLTIDRVCEKVIETVRQKHK
jgi:CMP/dCMP kinase